MSWYTDGHEPQIYNPMTHEGKCTWYLDPECTQEVTIFFNYMKQHGVMYVTEIDYSSPVAVTDETLKEAVTDHLGPCQFEDTEIVRS